MFGFRLRPRAAAATGVLAVGLAAALAGCIPAAAPDPALWTSRALAAQLVIAQLPMSQLALARTWAAQDLGGITIIGGPPPISPPSCAWYVPPPAVSRCSSPPMRKAARCSALER